MDRRNFVKTVSATAGVTYLSSRFAFAGLPVSDQKIRLGVVGGNFGLGFYFNEHPNCHVEAVSDLIPERRQALMRTYQCNKSYDSLEELLRDPRIEAVALFTPAPDHAAHAIQTLNAGKHVLSAVPAVMNMKEAYNLFKTVKRTGLTYMMAETSTYFQIVISAKKMYQEGAFGNIFSSAAQYYHPGLEELYFTDKGETTWRHGLPPMLYPTHVTSHLVAVTGERLVTVSCNGWGDDSPILKKNRYNNPFWNETAFFKTDRGNTFLGEVCWRGALIGTERGEWHGDKMSYYSGYKGTGDHQVTSTSKMGVDHGGFAVAETKMTPYPRVKWWETEMLPLPMRHGSGHDNSHCFITHEFIDSLVNEREPEVNIREALAYTVPGIIAHESALKKGELLKIPVIG
ncbi:MAG: Gfo/Idh/MocA family oxidoreductase [Bacteroidales bacterium]|jgi:predicted dehydrogenase|nr:Gfo/Idh/MocA family oxidoreductase [Bacteroidales bacterium]